MNPSAKLSICLYSDANFLALNILENLLSRDCVITVVTNNTNDWKLKTSHLLTNSKLFIINRNSIGLNSSYNYTIFCGGFLNPTGAYVEYTDFISLKNISAAKTLVIFPFEIFDRNQVDRIKVTNNIAVIFISDIIGPRLNLESDLLISKSISEILWKRKLTLAVGEVFFPVFVPDAVRVLVKWLFSFGPYGKVTFVLGNQTSGDVFWNANQKYFQDLELKYDPKLPPRILPKNFDTEIINCNLNYALGETYSWQKSNWEKQSIKPVDRKDKIKTVNRKPKKDLRKAKYIIWSLFAIFTLPLIVLAFSLITSLIAYKSFVYGKDNFAISTLSVGRTLAMVSEKGGSLFSYIPGIGLIYKETKFAASLTEQIDMIGIHIIPVAREATVLFEDVLGNRVYDSRIKSLKIESDLALLYNDVLLTKSLTDIAFDNNIVLAKKILAKVDFNRYTNLVSKGRVLAGNLPQLLGQEKSKTYLVLFENNMELRPTGGFIGSFGLVTFDGGRLSDLTVNDVYSADGQLNGHVEPPLPIKNYLGEANWWLRDSNWDPDFPTSAKRAEWFLDKELTKQVDGVFAIDLFPIKEILKVTGPIFLSDYNMSITPENLYEKTQSEVETNFFPGTHKKASFLTALARNLLAEIAKPKSNQKSSLLKIFYDSLNERHVQIYLHDSISQEAFYSLGWDGSVTSPDCGISCYSDLVGVVEANVGMNKVNYFIQRKIKVDVSIKDNEVNRKLTLTIVNPANPALGPPGRYKAYVRILVPTDAVLASAVGYNGNIQEALLPEITEPKGRKEVGVLVEILAGDTKNIEFSWSSKFDTGTPITSYGLYIRKQAGTEEDPISINIKDNNTKINPDPRLTLTRDGVYTYNTTLVRDLFIRTSW